jgi:hypothetical protein
MAQCDFFDCKEIAVDQVPVPGVEGGSLNICGIHQNALKSPRVTYEVDMKAHKLRMRIQEASPDR